MNLFFSDLFLHLQKMVEMYNNVVDAMLRRIFEWSRNNLYFTR